MDEKSIRSYPLYWPESWPRTEPGKKKRAKFKDRSVTVGRREIETQIKLFGGKELIISTNLELRNDGLPRSGQRQPQDVGVSIFFTRNKQEMALACDLYMTVEDNLWALCRTLDALRQIERDGSPALINRAFKGFAALPDPEQRDWWDVLSVPKTATDGEIRAAYISLAKKYHPDAGGDAAVFDQVQKAYDMAMGNRR